MKIAQNIHFIWFYLATFLPIIASAAYSHLEPRSATVCQVLKTKYPTLTAPKYSGAYLKQKKEYWDQAAILSPECIFTPKTPQHVAGALKISSETRTKFAVRSGGHMPIAGASGIIDGTLIVSDDLRGIELVTSESGPPCVRVGPGLRWMEVYEWLAKQGLTAGGARYAAVGVGGFALGGGLTYYRSVAGWAADHILNYEIVSGEGKILQVNRQSYPDLFWALKGGSGNFGFITSIDFEVYPLIGIYGGTFITDVAGTDAVVKASADYADPVNGGVLDELGAVNPTVQLDLNTRERISFTNLFYNASVMSPPAAFKNFTDLAEKVTSTVSGPRPFIEFMNETAAFPNDMRRLFRATSIKMHPQAVFLAQQVFDTETAKLRPITKGSITITYQYISQSAVDAMHENGNAIDLNPKNGPLIAILLASAWSHSTDDKYILDSLISLIASIDTASRAANFYYPFIFLNDAGEGQEPLKLYGGGQSLGRMRRVQRKYDPQGVYKQLAAGAFKM
ncbi:MAG: hypothetical protein Q9166_007157 [cf. Caloplaca sp. 2 TL-2023]